MQPAASSGSTVDSQSAVTVTRRVVMPRSAMTAEHGVMHTLVSFILG
jgi:hypothetical protein